MQIQPDNLAKEAAELGLGSLVVKAVSPLESADLVLRSPCFEAIMTIVDDTASLKKHWTHWQHIVEEYMDANPSLPHDLYLTFLVTRDNPSLTPAVIEEITSDPAFCRKFVLIISNGEVKSALSSLPFVPAAHAPRMVAPKLDTLISSAFLSHEYPSEIAEVFGQRKASERIAESLLQKVPPKVVPKLSTEDFMTPMQLQQEASGSKDFGLRSLGIVDFRGIRNMTLDLDANLVVIYGRNGTGKTSIIDAIEWGILGEVGRLIEECPDDEGSRSPLVHLFSEDQTATVTLTLESQESSLCIERTISHEGKPRTVLNEQLVMDDHHILDGLIGYDAESIDLRILRSSIRNSSFLAQTTLKQFLSSMPDERYSSVSRILGTQQFGRYLDKLSAVRDEMISQNEDLSAKRSVIEEEAKNIQKQIRQRQRTLRDLPSGRNIIGQLRRSMSKTREMLTGLESPFTSAIPSRVENYDDVLSFHGILVEWTSQKTTLLNQERQGWEKVSDILRTFPEVEKRASDMRRAVKGLDSQASILRRNISKSTKAKEQLCAEILSSEARRKAMDTKLYTLGRGLSIQRDLFGHQESLRETESNIKKIVEQLKVAEAAYKEKVNSEKILGQELRKHSSLLELKRVQVKQLATLESAVKEWASQAARVDELRAMATTVAQEMDQLRKRRSRELSRLKGTERERETVENAIARETQSLKKLEALRVELSQFTEGPACPFCGHDWQTPEQLEEQIRKKRGWNSQRIQTLQRGLADTSEAWNKYRAGVDELDKSLAEMGQRSDEINNETHTLEMTFARVRLLSATCGLEGSKDLGLSTVTGLRLDLERESAALENENESLQIQLKELAGDREDALETVRRLEDELTTSRKSYARSKTQVENLKKKLLDILPMDLRDQPTKVEKRIAELQSTNDVDEKQAEQRASRLAKLESSLSELQTTLNELEERKADREREFASTSTQLNEFRALLQDFEVEPNTEGKKIQARAEEIKKRLRTLKKLETEAGSIRTLASWLSAEREIESLQGTETTLRSQSENIQKRVNRCSVWIAHLGQLHEAVEWVRGDVENSLLAQYEPTVNWLYKRLSSHPLFGAIRTTVDPKSQSLKISLDLSDQLNFGSTALVHDLGPTRYFSEAQQNVLALSIFLSNALQQRWSQFGTVFLDDPVQNMDDFNANALIDTLRTLALGRQQFILTTCDLDFYKLLLVKLGCLNNGQIKRFKAYRLEGISLDGPTKYQDA